MTPAPEAQIVEPGNRWMQFAFTDKAPGPLANAVVWIDYPKVVRGQCACGAKYPVIVSTLPAPLRLMMEGSRTPFYLCKCNSGSVLE